MTEPSATDQPTPPEGASAPPPAPPKPQPTLAPEFGGPSGLEPTRFGDWEKGGRCIDF